LSASGSRATRSSCTSSANFFLAASIESATIVSVSKGVSESKKQDPTGIYYIDTFFQHRESIDIGNGSLVRNGLVNPKIDRWHVDRLKLALLR
jgi:hypothetical protein